MDIFNYRQKMEGLHAKIRQSETERRDLETKLHQMMRRQNERDKTKMRSLKDRYENFLEEEKRRLTRNDKLLQTMEDIDYRASTLAAKTERLKLLKSQYELYLTRTWSPTRPTTMSSSSVLMELPQPPHHQYQQHMPPAGRLGSVLRSIPVQSLVYKCPSSVNANPQLNIQLPQYYRHSTIDSCSPTAAAVEYNQLLAAPQIILSGDSPDPTRMATAATAVSGPLTASLPAANIVTNNSSLSHRHRLLLHHPQNNAAGICNVNRPDTDSLSSLMAPGMSSLGGRGGGLGDGDGTARHLLMPSSGATTQLFLDPTVGGGGSQLPNAFVSEAARRVGGGGGGGEGAASESTSSSSVYPPATTDRNVNQSCGTTVSLSSMGAAAPGTRRSQGSFRAGHGKEWEKNAEFGVETDISRNTGNQLETFAAATTTSIVAPAFDYYSSNGGGSGAGGGGGGARYLAVTAATAPAEDLHRNTEKYEPGKSNDVNDGIIPASYRLLSLSDPQQQRNSQQMPMDDGVAFARRRPSSNYKDDDRDDDIHQNATAPLQSTTNVLIEHSPKPELENYAEEPKEAAAATFLSSSAYSAGKTKTSSPLNYRSTDHYFDDYVAAREAGEVGGGVGVGGQIRTIGLGNKEIPVGTLYNNTTTPAAVLSSPKQVHQKWEKVIEVVDEQQQQQQEANTLPDQFIDTLGGTRFNRQPASDRDTTPQTNYYRVEEAEEEKVDLGNEKSEYYAEEKETGGYARALGQAQRGEEQEQEEDYEKQLHQYNTINENNYPDRAEGASGMEPNNNNMSQFTSAAAGQRRRHSPIEQHRVLPSGTGKGSPNKSFAYEDDATAVVSYSSPQKQRLQSPASYYTAPVTAASLASSGGGSPEGGNSNQGSPRKRLTTQLQHQQPIEEERPLEMEQSYYTPDDTTTEQQQQQHSEEGDLHHEMNPSTLVNNPSGEGGGGGGGVVGAHDSPLSQQQLRQPLEDPLHSSTYQSQSHYPNTGAVDDYGGNYEETGYVAAVDDDVDDQRRRRIQPEVDYGNYLADAAAAAAPMDNDNYQLNYPNDQNYAPSAIPDESGAFGYNDDDGHNQVAYGNDGTRVGTEYQDYYNPGDGQQQQPNYPISGQEMDMGANYGPADGNYANDQGQSYYGEPEQQQQQQQQLQQQHQGDYYESAPLYQEQQFEHQDYYSEPIDYNNPTPDHQQQPSVSFAEDNVVSGQDVLSPAAIVPAAPTALASPEKPKKPVKKVQILESSESDSQPAGRGKAKGTAGRPTGSVLKGGLRNKSQAGASSSDSSDFNFSSKKAGI